MRRILLLIFVGCLVLAGGFWLYWLNVLSAPTPNAQPVDTPSAKGKPTTIEEWLHAARSTDKDLHTKAITFIGGLDPRIEGVVPVLLDDFQTKERLKWEGPILPLMRMEPKTPGVTAAFVTALDYPDKGRRTAAISYLGTRRLQPKTVIPKLILLVQPEPPPLEGKGPGPAYYAVRALGDYGTEAAAALPVLVKLFPQTSDNPRLRAASVRALDLIDPNNDSTLRIVQEALKDKSLLVQALVVDHLYKHQRLPLPATLKILQAALQSRDSKCRRQVVRTLGVIGPAAQEAAPALAVALTDEDRFVRRIALDSLRKLGTPAEPVVLALGMVLRDPNLPDRNVVAEYLGSLGAKARVAIPALDKALGDKNSFLRAASALALIQLGEPQEAAWKTLREVLRDKEKFVRSYAADGLAKLGPQAKTTIPDLVRLLEDESFEVRFSAGAALLSIGGPNDNALKVLLAGLKNADTRRKAVVSLSRAGPNAKEAAPALTELLNDKDADVRLAVIRSLWKVAGQLQPTEDGLKDPSNRIRLVTAYWAGELGSQARPITPALAKVNQDDLVTPVRTAAANALKKIAPEETKEKGI